MTSRRMVFAGVLLLLVSGCAQQEPQEVTETNYVTETPEPAIETVTASPEPTSTETVTVTVAPSAEAAGPVSYSASAGPKEQAERVERLGLEYSLEVMALKVRAFITANAVGGRFHDAAMYRDDSPQYIFNLHELAVEAVLPICVNLTEGHEVGPEDFKATVNLLLDLAPAHLPGHDAQELSDIAIQELCPDVAAEMRSE